MRHESDWTIAAGPDGGAEDPRAVPADDRRLAAVLALSMAVGLASWAGVVAGVMALLG